MSAGGRRKLVWRLYLLGFVQLVVLGAAVAGVGYLLRPAHPPFQPFFDRGDGHFLPPDLRPPLECLPGRGLGPGGRPWRPPFPWAPLFTFLMGGLVIVGVGSFLTAQWIVRPLQTLSKTARALGAGDLRARAGMNRHDEIGEVGRAFDEMADRVERLLLAERELLANVSHELRTPLARIHVALDLASEAAGGGPSLGEIALDLSEIESLIDDILTATRLEIEGGRAPSSGFSLHVESIAPSVLCERASQRFRARHPDRELRLCVDEPLPLVEADPVFFRRAIDNLLENAHKYTPNAEEPILLQARTRNGLIEIAVLDRGMGIAPEDLPHVFRSFFRSDRSRSRGTGGVGLGLTLAKRIVEAHGGRIDLSSAPGIGTSVRILLETTAPGRAISEIHDPATG